MYFLFPNSPNQDPKRSFAALFKKYIYIDTKKIDRLQSMHNN